MVIKIDLTNKLDECGTGIGAMTVTDVLSIYTFNIYNIISHSLSTTSAPSGTVHTVSPLSSF